MKIIPMILTFIISISFVDCSKGSDPSGKNAIAGRKTRSVGQGARYEGVFRNIDGQGVLEIMHEYGDSYTVIFKGKNFIGGEQTREMKLLEDRKTLYFEREGESGGLIFSPNLDSVETVGGGNERPVYRRTR